MYSTCVYKVLLFLLRRITTFFGTSTNTCIFVVFSDLQMGDSIPNGGSQPADYDFLIKFLALGECFMKLRNSQIMS